ncbi:MAG: ATP-binding protein, partial [Gammaproteobacteria bacterium]|nr:ATP-binding protein [Gammaproteobacteria bacterium]
AMTLPIMFAALFSAKSQLDNYLLNVKSTLKNDTKDIAREIEYFIESNAFVIEKQAEILSLTRLQQEFSSLQLRKLHADNAEFNTMIITDRQGIITASSPAYEKTIVGMSVADREYFKQAIMGRHYISDAFMGRGFEVAPIIAISAPIYDHKSRKVTGILEGSLFLKNMHRYIDLKGEGLDVLNRDILITDNKNRVIYTTLENEVEVFQTIDWHESANLSFLGFNSTVYINEPIISEGHILKNRWAIRSIYRVGNYNEYARDVYQDFALIVLAAILFVGSLAAYLSYHINGPIKWLLKRTQRLSLAGDVSEPVNISPYVPSELFSLMRAQESAERRLRISFEAENIHLEKRIMAEKANKAKSVFLSAMSHELRTPLNAISGFSQILASSENQEEEVKGIANEIYMASQHLVLLLNDIMDMSMIEINRIKLKQDKIKLKQLLDQTLPMLQSSIKSKNIKLNLQVPEKEIEVINDMLRLKQVIINLLSNAIKYNKHHGELTIKLAHQGKKKTVTFEVIDTGEGIPSEKIEAIFRLFNRADNDNSHIEGYGIGLSITKVLIDMMGGQIEVDSKLNYGTSFRITLPVNIPEQETSDKEDLNIELGSIAIRACRILYVEDNEVNAIVMAKAMQRFPQIDYQRVAEGKKAIEMIKESYFDFILMDISLNDMTGFDVLEVIQKSESKLYGHIFAVSANAMAEDVQNGIEKGFDEYLTKPVKFNSLFSRINKYQNQSS